MKYNKILIACLAIAMSLSCNRKVDFPHATFVTLDETKLSVKEDCSKMILPVYLYNPTGEDVQVSVTAIDGTAKASDDYEIVKPANGILTFSGDVDSLAIEVEISDKYVGTITKNKKFNIRISSADVSMGAYSDAVITIKDLDHPLDKIGLIDTFVGKVHEDVYNQTIDMSLVITVPEDDDTFEKVLVTGLEPYYASYAVDTPLEGRYDEVNSKLIIKKGQVAMEVSGYSFVLTGTTDGSDELDIEFLYDQDAGKLTLVSPYGEKCLESTADPEAAGYFFTWYDSASLVKKN